LGFREKRDGDERLVLIQTVPGDQAFRPLDKGDCPLLKKG